MDGSSHTSFVCERESQFNLSFLFLEKYYYFHLRIRRCVYTSVALHKLYIHVMYRLWHSHTRTCKHRKLANLASSIMHPGCGSLPRWCGMEDLSKYMPLAYNMYELDIRVKCYPIGHVTVKIPLLRVVCMGKHLSPVSPRANP